MNCPKCGSQAADGNAFCTRCGAPMSGHVHQPYGHQTQSSAPNRNGLLTASTVLMFVSGGIGILGSLFLILFSTVFMNLLSYGDPEISQPFNVVSIIYLVMGLLLVLPSILAIVGGFKTRKRTSFGWAIAGSIGAIIASAAVSMIPGILACVFIALSKQEFDAQPQ